MRQHGTQVVKPLRTIGTSNGRGRGISPAAWFSRRANPPVRKLDFLENGRPSVVLLASAATLPGALISPPGCAPRPACRSVDPTVFLEMVFLLAVDSLYPVACAIDLTPAKTRTVQSTGRELSRAKALCLVQVHGRIAGGDNWGGQQGNRSSSNVISD
jgi:hypothetical protein